MSMQALGTKTLRQSPDEAGTESILNRFDAVIGEMMQLRLHTLTREMTQLRQLIQGLIPAKPATADFTTTATAADEEDWVEELYGSLGPPQPRSLADELDFYNSLVNHTA